MAGIDLLYAGLPQAFNLGEKKKNTKKPVPMKGNKAKHNKTSFVVVVQSLSHV